MKIVKCNSYPINDQKFKLCYLSENFETKKLILDSIIDGHTLCPIEFIDKIINIIGTNYVNNRRFEQLITYNIINDLYLNKSFICHKNCESTPIGDIVLLDNGLLYRRNHNNSKVEITALFGFVFITNELYCELYSFNMSDNIHDYPLITQLLY